VAESVLVLLFYERGFMTTARPYTHKLPEINTRRGWPQQESPKDAAAKDALRRVNDPRAKRFVETTLCIQSNLWQDLLAKDAEGKVGNRHHLIIGGTSGIGAAVTIALISILKNEGSITNISMDQNDFSAGYFLGRQLEAFATYKDLGNRYRWFPDGMSLKGEQLESHVAHLREIGANNLIYYHFATGAIPGMLKNMPTVYVLDAEPETHELFQWELMGLSEGMIDRGKNLMGVHAIGLPEKLREQGIAVKLENFMDWRGATNYSSREPENDNYGEEGPYSGSLAAPKDIIRNHTIATMFDTSKVVLFHSLPTLGNGPRSQRNADGFSAALPLIPGGMPLAWGFEQSFEIDSEYRGVRWRSTPELGGQVVITAGDVLSSNRVLNGFPDHAAHESAFDFRMRYVGPRINNNSDSHYYYKKVWGLE